jgi:ABC-type sugar transport system permease subunit
VGYPFVAGFWYSLNSGSLLRQAQFVGSPTTRPCFSMEAFQNAAWFSFCFALCNVVGCYLLGLGLAMLMNLRSCPGAASSRIALLHAVDHPVGGLDRELALDARRPTPRRSTQLIAWFGGDPIYFLSSDHWAVVAVILVKIWRSFRS